MADNWILRYITLVSCPTKSGPVLDMHETDNSMCQGFFLHYSASLILGKDKMLHICHYA